MVQYKKMGHGPFFARYGADLRKHGFDADELYRYKRRTTTWATETLEGQAEIAGAYAEQRFTRVPAAAAVVVELERRLKGSGLYGL